MLAKKFGEIFKLSGLACKAKCSLLIVVHLAVIGKPTFSVQAEMPGAAGIGSATSYFTEKAFVVLSLVIKFNRYFLRHRKTEIKIQNSKFKKGCSA